MKIQNILKPICFITIFVLILNFINKLFVPRWISYGNENGDKATYTIQEMNELEKDSIDVAFVGSSQLVFGVSPAYMLGEYGIASYDMATLDQPTICTYYYVRKLIDEQKPKVVILETSMLFEDFSEPNYRITCDSVGLDKNKLDMLISHYGDDKEFTTLFSSIFPIYEYHSRWNELDMGNFGKIEDDNILLAGQIMAGKIYPIKKELLVIDNDMDTEEKMVPTQEKYMRKSIEYCLKHNTKVLLIKTPKRAWTRTKSEMVSELAAEYGVEYLDFNTARMLDAIGVDVNHDFKDPDHLNMYGAQKLTDYLSRYLLMSGNDFDKKLPQKYSSKLVDTYRQRYIKKDSINISDPMEFFEYAKDYNYDLFITCNSDVKWFWTNERLEAYEELGSKINFWDINNYLGAYVACVNENGIVYEETSEWNIDYQYGEVSLWAKYKGDGGNRIIVSEKVYRGTGRSVVLVLVNRETNKVVNAKRYWRDGNINKVESLDGE